MTNFHSATGLAMGSFGIGTFRQGGEKSFPALVKPDGTVYDLSASYQDTHAIFDDWNRALDGFKTLSDKGGVPELRYEALEPRPVVSHPNMMCAGSNYRQHVAEMMTHNKFNQDKRLPGESDESFFTRNLAEVDRRAREGMPFFWTGLHSSLSGANDDVSLPPVGEHHDWELEFGVILCGAGRFMRPEETESIIAGYVMVNDLGTVDEFRRSDVRWGHDWVSKHQPGFKPIGPFMVPKEFVDRSKVQIKLQVNGKVMQDWPISDMIFPPEKILSYASERIRMMPGDLLITGSPPGNGAMMGQFLAPGDVIESEITFLGRQRNNVVAENLIRPAPLWGRFPIWAD
jgi:2,4-didehydro-3-deoxy-L-rhamnonate hydrolase